MPGWLDTHGAADPQQQCRKQLGVELQHRWPGRRGRCNLVQRTGGLQTGPLSLRPYPQRRLSERWTLRLGQKPARSPSFFAGTPCPPRSWALGGVAVGVG